MSFSASFTIVIAFLYFAMALWGGFYDGIGADLSALERIAQFDIFRDAEINIFIASFSFPIPNFAYFGAWGDLLTWNSSLWTGWASYIRIAILMIFTISIVLPLMVSLLGAFLSRSRV